MFSVSKLSFSFAQGARKACVPLIRSLRPCQTIDGIYVNRRKNESMCLSAAHLCISSSLFRFFFLLAQRIPSACACAPRLTPNFNQEWSHSAWEHRRMWIAFVVVAVIFIALEWASQMDWEWKKTSTHPELGGSNEWVISGFCKSYWFT